MAIFAITDRLSPTHPLVADARTPCVASSARPRRPPSPDDVLLLTWIILSTSHAMPDHDPNFPPSLNIAPLAPLGIQHESNNQQEAIEKYGIAGRVWEASRPLVRYFTPTTSPTFDPPCPVFQGGPSSGSSPRRILELGSGQGVASLHLANYLDPEDTLVLTDLDNVIPLCDLSINCWKEGKDVTPNVTAQGLGWGGDSSNVRALGPFDYIIMCDLVRR